jgi:hypothetical protein
MDSPPVFGFFRLPTGRFRLIDSGNEPEMQLDYFATGIAPHPAPFPQFVILVSGFGIPPHLCKSDFGQLPSDPSLSVEDSRVVPPPSQKLLLLLRAFSARSPPAKADARAHSSFGFLV